MATQSPVIEIIYSTEYGTAPSTRYREGYTGSYTLIETDLPVLTHEGYTFLGWYCDGELMTVGSALASNGNSNNNYTTTYTFAALWQKETTYVIVDKDDLVSIADSVRSFTGETGKFNAKELVQAAIAAIQESGGATGENCTVTGKMMSGTFYYTYFNDQGQLTATSFVVNGSASQTHAYEIAKNSVAFAFVTAETKIDKRTVSGDVLEILFTGQVASRVLGYQINGDGGFDVYYLDSGGNNSGGMVAPK